MKDFQEKYKEMVLFMEKGEGQSTAEHLMAKTTLPFTSRVLNFPLPDKFKDPWVDKYDESGDPSDHVEGFRAHLALHGTPDEIACRAFPLTLKGVAKDWFSNLKPQSIDNFDTLGGQFMNQFLAIRRRKKNPAYLLSLVQEKEEPLKDYLHRFNQEKLTVKSPDDQTILSALMNGINADGPLMAELARKPTLGTLSQFMRKAEEFVNQEENINALTKRKKVKQEEEGDKEEGPSNRRRKTPRTVERKTEPFQVRNQPQSQKWTPLNVNLSTVLMEIKRDPAFRWPPRMRTPPEKRNNQKFCEYHNDHGHQTEDCMALRREIELLIQNGKLIKFVANEKRSNEESRRSPQQRIAGLPRKAFPEN
jgi:hypothetical protein